MYITAEARRADVRPMLMQGPKIMALTPRVSLCPFDFVPHTPAGRPLLLQRFCIRWIRACLPYLHSNQVVQGWTASVHVSRVLLSLGFACALPLSVCLSLFFFFFGYTGVFLAASGLPLLVVGGRTGFSLWWLLLLQSTGSRALGLQYLQSVGSSAQVQ